jgi:phospholipase/carboxylesterase
MGTIGRRQFGLLTTTVIASLLVPGCRRLFADVPNDGRLPARPKQTNRGSQSGDVSIDIDSRHAILRLPSTSNGKPLPLLVLLHGAGQTAEDMLEYLGQIPSQAGVATLVPKSRRGTWDAIGGSFGPDVDFINVALGRVFELEAIDPARIAIGGFSDGASYALSLGLINGDLFGKVAAFSPGFIVAGMNTGKPKFFISHGTDDPILPIGPCSRRIVRDLKSRSYDVTFREFPGGHEVPEDIASEAMKWIAP